MSIKNLDSFVETAINKVKSIINLIEIGEPLIHRRGNDMCVDIPLMYNGFALDRIHFDVELDTFSPKGKPCSRAVENIEIRHIKERARELINALEVIPAVEFREPENAWAVPLKWRHFIVAHIKMTYDGSKIVPDYALTGELKMKMSGV